MKCLLIFPDAPLSQNYYAGGATRYTQAFQALTLLGHEVHVLRLLSSGRKESVTNFEANLCPEDAKNYNSAKSWRDLSFQYGERFKTRLEGIRKGLFSPLDFAFPETKMLQESFCTAIEELEPEFIVAQMLPAGAVVAALKPSIPWIYGHHDWRYRLRQNRLKQTGRSSLAGLFTSWALRRGEVRVVRESTAVVAASVTEAAEIVRLGVKHCVAIPSTYASASMSFETWPHNMRIVHFGSLRTPASLNIRPLTAYVEQVVPQLPRNWEFVIVGATDSAPRELLERMRTVGAKLKGFVPDLATVLRPFDVAVIPYSHNTGERTRIAQLFNYAQVVVTIGAAAKGSSYLEPGRNCITVSSLSEYPAKLKYLAEHPELRRQIGLAAKATFERELTLNAQLPKFQQIIDAAVQG